MVKGSSTSEVLQPPDAGEVLQRLGVSDVVVRQSATLGLAWKNLTPADGKLAAQLLPTAMEGAARTAVTRQLAASFSKAPVYSLKTDGSLKEQAARQTLKSIRIEPDRIVARFGLL